MLFDVYSNLKFAKDEQMRKLNFKNKALLTALELNSMDRARYEEGEAARYDPLKPRILGALAEALTKSDLSDLHQIQQNEMGRANESLYPYNPDLVMGYHGQKVGLFLLNDNNVMRDTRNPDGKTVHQMALVEQSHSASPEQKTPQIKTIGLAMNQIVDYDLAKYKLSLRNDFNLSEFMSRMTESSNLRQLDFDALSQFSSSLAQETAI